jgi:protein-disulfide isomerase
MRPTMRSDRVPIADPSAVPPLDETVDHVRGPAGAPLIIEYGDYHCHCSRDAYHAVKGVVLASGGSVRFAFRHFPLIVIHPLALAAARAAEAAARQERFWEMTELLFDRQEAFADDGPRRIAAELGLDLAAFDADRTHHAALDRIRRDIESGLASRQVQTSPTVFIDGVLHRGRYDTASLLKTLDRIDAMHASTAGPSTLGHRVRDVPVERFQ